jgi:hypothetical protein
MKQKTYVRRLNTIEECKIYHVKQYIHNNATIRQNHPLNTCLEHIKNLYALDDAVKNIIYNMSHDEKMHIIIEYDNNLQSILKNMAT